jgi:hypothetical protein
MLNVPATAQRKGSPESEFRCGSELSWDVKPDMILESADASFLVILTSSHRSYLVILVRREILSQGPGKLVGVAPRGWGCGVRGSKDGVGRIARIGRTGRCVI